MFLNLIPLLLLKLYVSYDINRICRELLSEELDKRNISYVLSNSGELIVKDRESQKKLESIKQDLALRGIDFVDNEKMILVEKIKAIILKSISDETIDEENMSICLTNKLNHTYSYLAKIFTEATHSTIENFTILAKIEKVKSMLLQDKLSLTEVAYKLNYSSVAHLSRQFKKKTGLTPTHFQRLIKVREYSH